MTKYRVQCTHCHRGLKVSKEHLGGHIKCPACNEVFGVPLVAELAETTVQAETVPPAPPKNAYQAPADAHAPTQQKSWFGLAALLVFLSPLLLFAGCLTLYFGLAALSETTESLLNEPSHVTGTNVEDDYDHLLVQEMRSRLRNAKGGPVLLIEVGESSYELAALFEAIEVPEKVRQGIVKRSEKEYPHDFANQEADISQQIEGWKRMVAPIGFVGMPQDTFNRIRGDARNKYPNDFTNQRYYVGQYVEAWFALQEEKRR